MQIIPTVLEKNFEEAEKRIEGVKEKSKWISIDVIDGIFAPGNTFGLELLNKLDFEAEGLNWDIHLMVKDPIKWINKCEFVQASRIIGQVEMMADREAFVKAVKDRNMEAGLGFDVESRIEKIPMDTDVVLVMGRKAGFEEEKMRPETPKRIEEAKGGGWRVGIDGGVNKDNIDKMEQADIVYCGKAFWEIIKLLNY